MAKRGSDSSVIIGIIMGFGGVLAGFLYEGGGPASLINVSALIIIVFGTLGALTASFSLRQVLGIPKIIQQALKSVPGPSPQLAQQLLEFAEKARRDGILSLEDTVEDLEDEMLRKGLRLVVDGTESEVLADVLESDLAILESRQLEGSEIFEAAGGYSPTIGIIGAVLGLIQVMQHLDKIDEVGKGIAVAFVATLYGVGAANLILLPVAGKLKIRIRDEQIIREMTLEGVVSILEGMNPRMLEVKLLGFLVKAREPAAVPVEEEPNP